MIQRALENMPQTIGKRLATVRAMSGLSAAALGETAGLSRAIVSMIENGERPNPNLGTLTKLAKLLDISVHWLIDGSGEKPRKKAVLAALAKAEAAGQLRKGAA